MAVFRHNPHEHHLNFTTLRIHTLLWIEDELLEKNMMGTEERVVEECYNKMDLHSIINASEFSSWEAWELEIVSYKIAVHWL